MNLPRSALAALTVTALLFSSAACSSKGDDPAPASLDSSATAPGLSTPASAASAVASAAAPSPAAACTSFPTGISPGQTSAVRLTSGGVDRLFRIHVPLNLKPADRAPIVLNFHGLGSSSVEQEFYSGLVPVSDREGFFLVTPDGTGTPRSFAAFRNLGNTDDVQFTRDLLDRLAKDFCIDTARVYSTGLSNGAFMSSRLACVLSDRIAAIAPVAGVYRPDEACGRPVPVLAFHGTDDAVVPYAGGNVLGVLTYAGAEKGTSGWAGATGCTPSLGTKETQLTENVKRTDYLGCGALAGVSLVTVNGGGHTWPGAIDVPGLGFVTKEVSAAEMIWAFFKDIRLPR